jgi:hypothetical protein
VIKELLTDESRVASTGCRHGIGWGAHTGASDPWRYGYGCTLTLCCYCSALCDKLTLVYQLTTPSPRL